MTFSDKLISLIKQLAKQLQQAQIAVIDNQIAISDKCFLLQELNLHLNKMNVKSQNLLLNAFYDLFLNHHAQLKYTMMFFSQIMFNYIKNFD